MSNTALEWSSRLLLALYIIDELLDVVDLKRHLLPTGFNTQRSAFGSESCDRRPDCSLEP